jgi:LCP family protein required for cell wall assembly
MRISQADTQPIGPQFQDDEWRKPARRSGCRRFASCLTFFILSTLACLILSLAILMLAPQPIHILILGVDRAPKRSFAGRTDTIMLMRADSREPYVGLLSIPRDLWIEIPGEGPGRINSAHYVAEINQPGSGGSAAKSAASQAFGVPVHYYLRVRFQGLRAFVNALGGVTVRLPEAMGGLPAGEHHLDGKAALTFVRYRATDDDFLRMARGQLFVRALMRQMLNPSTWPHLPSAALKAAEVIDSDVPILQWPAVLMALLRVGPDGIDARTFTYDMVQPFTTAGGAAVLAPIWERIFPVVHEMFFR